MQKGHFDFLDVNPVEIYLGKNNGGLFFAAERPRHNVEIKYKYSISKCCVSEEEWKDVFKNKDIIPDYNQFNQQNIDEFFQILNQRGNDAKFRLPSESEWELAKIQLEEYSDFPHKNGELIADQPHVSYWGAPCNGSPWLEKNQKYAGYGMQLLKNPDNLFGLLNFKNASKRGVSQHKSHKRKIRFRILKLSKDHVDSLDKKLPLDFDRFEILKREVFIAIIIGIIPSFIWAYFNASPGYIVRGFGNLILGGVFFSLITGLIFRPKHSTLKYSNNNIIAISPYRKKIKTLVSFEDEYP